MLDTEDRLIGLIYDGVRDDSNWELALRQVAEHVRAIGAGIGMQNLESHRFRDLAAIGINSDLMATYRLLAPTNKIWMEIGQSRRPKTDRMVMPKTAFERTRLYVEWFVPQAFHSVMAFPIMFKDSDSAVVCAFRDARRGDFGPADLAKIGRFAGHFGRALSIYLDRERTARELVAANLMADEIPDTILLVDRAALVKYANKAGRDMLAAAQSIRLRKGRLEICEPKADQALAAIVSEGRGGEIVLAVPGRPERVAFRVHPCTHDLGSAAGGLMIVRIVDLDRKGEPLTVGQICGRLALSPQQAAVVSKLARGSTEKEAAEELGLKQATVHTYVRRVYDRLEICSRADLMALLARCGFDTTGRAKD